MSKLIEDKEDNYTELGIKLDLLNFGVDQIYVITNLEDTRRKEAFEKAWSIFKGFDYKFIPAVFGKDLDINLLLKSQQISEYFYDNSGNLSSNILATALSHRKVYVDAYAEKHNRILVLEDDARPSHKFYDYIISGKYLKVLDDIENLTYYTYFLGQPQEKIYGDYLNGISVNMRRNIQFAAHAYILDCNALPRLLEETESIKVAADVVLQGPWNEFNCLGTSHSIIMQQGHLLNKFFIEDPNDPDYIFRSQTQPHYEDRDHELGYNIGKELSKYVRGIEEVEYYDHNMVKIKLGSSII